MEFPPSIDPSSEQRLAEKLSQDATDFADLEEVRRRMRAFFKESTTPSIDPSSEPE